MPHVSIYAKDSETGQPHARVHGVPNF